MTGEIARLFVSLFGDTSNFDKTLTDSQKKLQQASKNMNAIGKKMTMFVTLPLIGIGTAALKVSSNAEEMESKFLDCAQLVFSQKDAKQCLDIIWTLEQIKDITILMRLLSNPAKGDKV